MLSTHGNNRGQAMVEFVVSASAVLIPAFLLLPLVGKIIDMKQTSLEAARYASWEYTAWYASRKKPALVESFEPLRRNDLPVKSTAQLDMETAQRFFSDGSLALRDDDADTGWREATAKPLWNGPRGPDEKLYQPKPLEQDVTAQILKTPDPSKMYDDVIKVASTASSLMGGVMKVVGVQNAKFTALSSSGYDVSSVAIPVQQLAGLQPFDKLSLVLHAQAGVISEGWNAGGTKHADGQVRGLMPMVFFDNPLIHTIQSVAGFLAPEIKPNKLRFGYVNSDAVPPVFLKDPGPNGAKGADVECMEPPTGICE